MPLATLPFDAKLFGTAANNGQMLGEIDAGHRSAVTMLEIARAVTGKPEARKGRRSLRDHPLMNRWAGRKAS